LFQKNCQDHRVWSQSAAVNRITYFIPQFMKKQLRVFVTLLSIWVTLTCRITFIVFSHWGKQEIIGLFVSLQVQDPYRPFTFYY